MEVPRKTISNQAISSLINENRKRIHFATVHENALKKSNKDEHYGTFKLPFRDSAYPILQKECSIRMYDSAYDNGGIFCYVNDEAEYKRIEAFIQKYRNIVFLRDNLELSVALSVNFVIGKKRTEIGELEYLGKYKNDEEAAAHLAMCCSDFLRNTPFYKDADMLIAMPSSRRLPARVASGIEGFKGTICIDKIKWEDKRGELKNVENGEKIEILDKSGLTISEDLDVKDKVVILLDDLYKSGATIQFVAMKLKEAGASMVFGLSIVKSLSDKTDPDDAE